MKNFMYLAIGIAIGYGLRMFTGKQDIQTLIEYRDRITVRDTCLTRVDTVEIKPVIRKGKPKQVVMVKLDTVMVRDTVTVNVKEEARYSWKEIPYKDVYLTILDSVYTNGPIKGWNRDITLDTLELEKRFTVTHVVKETLPVIQKMNYVLFNGGYDGISKFGAGAKYMHYSGYGIGGKYYPTNKNFTIDVTVPLLKLNAKSNGND